MLCKIGSVEVWRVLEINAPFLRPDELFPQAGPDVTERVAELSPQGALAPESKRVILPVQGFLLKTPDSVILVDACVGNDKTNQNLPAWHMRSDPRFMAGLAAAGVSPEDVNYVMCTHLHTDHVGWNTRKLDGRWVPTFPNARYLFPQADDAFYSEKPSPSYKESVLPVIEAGQAELVGPDHELGDCVRLLATPGHTPGHVSVEISSEGASAIITGDAIHITAQCWHPEWEFVYDHDGPEAARSRRGLLERASETGCRVLGTHFQLPSLGRVTAKGDAFAWEDDG